MNRRIYILAGVAALCVAGLAGGQGRILDMVANKVIQKYQGSTCEQLWQKKGEPKSPEEQRVVNFLRNDAQALSFEAIVDRPGQVAPGRVRFDNRQRSFDRHCCISPGRKPAGYIGRSRRRQCSGAEILRDAKLRRAEVFLGAPVSAIGRRIGLGRRDCSDRLTAPSRVRAPP